MEIKENTGVVLSTQKGFKAFCLRFKRQLALQSMVIPWLIVIFIFSYLPMTGIILAFKDFDFRFGIFGSEWVGFRHFESLFSDADFFIAVRNTLAINFLKLLFSFPIPIIFTIMLNEMRLKSIVKGAQSLAYLPHFISWVIVAGIFTDMFAVDGYINDILVAFGLEERIKFLTQDWFFWPLMVITGSWKEAGWNSIIYIAALGNINPELYEAASVDGAGRWAKIRHITLPCLVPTIKISLLFTFAGMFTAGFDQIYLMQNDLNLKTSEVLDTYIYKYGMRKGLYSYSIAAGLVQGVVNFIVLISANFACKKMTGQGMY